MVAAAAVEMDAEVGTGDFEVRGRRTRGLAILSNHISSLGMHHSTFAGPEKVHSGN